MRKRVIPLLLALVCAVTAFALPVTAAPDEEATESPSTDRTYTLVLTLEYDDKPLSGITYHLYKVASMDVKKSIEHYYFALEEAFKPAFAAESGDPSESSDPSYSMEDLYDLGFWQKWEADALEKMANSLATYVEDNEIRADRDASTEANGKLTFKELKAGLYLVLGDPKTVGKTTYTPQAALVPVPFYYEGDATGETKEGWLTTVRIKAKVEVEDDKSDPSDPDDPDDPTTPPVDPDDPDDPPIPPNNPNDPDDPTSPPDAPPESSVPPGDPDDPGLPQTGQLWWPVPLLATVGVLLLLIGAVLFVRKEEPEEPHE